MPTPPSKDFLSWAGKHMSPKKLKAVNNNLLKAYEGSAKAKIRRKEQLENLPSKYNLPKIDDIQVNLP